MAVTIKTYPDGKLPENFAPTCQFPEQIAGCSGGSGLVNPYAAGFKVYESYNKFFVNLWMQQ